MMRKAILKRVKSVRTQPSKGLSHARVTTGADTAMKRVPLLSKDPTSHATASSRSNMMAVQHTVEQIYGEAVAQGVSDPKPTGPEL